MYTGTLLGYNDTEYFVETANQGNVTIRKYLVVSIVRLDAEQSFTVSCDNFRPSRNFISATAFSVEKGAVECSMYYIAAGNLDAGIAPRLTFSVSSAWLVVTVVGVKYSIFQSAGLSFAVAGTVGSLPFSGFSGEYSGVAGRGVLTFGRPDHYLSLSGGT